MSKEQYIILTLFSPIFILLFYLFIVIIVEDIKDYFHLKKKNKIRKEKLKKELEEYLEMAEKLRAITIFIDNFKDETNNE